MKSETLDLLGFVGKWGKAIDGHPLLYHMIDSASVAELLWRQGLTPGARRQFCEWLGLPEAECGQLLAFWTSLHDLGKATPSFQAKHAPSKERLAARGFDFPPLALAEIRHHSLLSQWILNEYGTQLKIEPPRAFNLFRYAIGGHHGAYHAESDTENSLAKDKNLGGPRWKAAQAELLGALQALLAPPACPPLSLNQTARNAFFNLLTGFFVCADWLASQDDLFQYHPGALSPAEYQVISRQRAEAALHCTGWKGWQPDEDLLTFEQLFPFQASPLQQAILAFTQELEEPFLAIVEAPTGCGKTEAALALAERAIRRGKLRGWYIAMPTQATSNQMYQRASRFLTGCYPRQSNINLQLAHGNAMLNEQFQQTRLAAVDDQEGAQEGSVSAMEWFLPRKRTLLAPFGVGTVDQTFMSVLRTKHSFLRLFGLHRKVVIFDEVHAYDTYMTRIFIQLLAWLRAIGTSVILLSATLPESTRFELLNAYQPRVRVDSDKAAYPRLSLNAANRVQTLALGAYPDRTVHLESVDYQPEAWLDRLRAAMAQGGCAAIICNTVDRAQEVYSAVRAAGLAEADQLTLIHARMPFCWRKAREDAILQQFGKLEQQASAPRRGIVVATQIIEQSLDLDFDLMISDLAPIDLLIQRIGRLHRHAAQRFAPFRPAKLSQPVCWICQPEPPDDKELPVFGADRWVYEKAILERTYFTLQGRNALILPAQSDELINLVYAETTLAACGAEQNQLLAKSMQAMQIERDKEITSAINRLVGDVDNSNVLAEKVVYLKEDEPSVGKDAQALTRNNIQPSVELVCLIRQDGGTCFLDQLYRIDLDQPPGAAALDHAIKSLVRVSKKEVVRYFNAQPVPESWKSVPALRHAHPVEFIQGEFKAADGSGALRLDPALGLVVDWK